MENQNEAPPPKRGLPGARRGTQQHTLSNGAVLEYRRPTGYDAEQAGKAAGEGASNQFITAALVASCATVDGERFTAEDFMGMDLAEINEVGELVVGKPQFPAADT